MLSNVRNSLLLLVVGYCGASPVVLRRSLATNSVLATENDILAILTDSEIRNACLSICTPTKGKLDRWTVNSDVNPDASGLANIEMKVAEVTWTGLDNPSVSNSQTTQTLDNSGSSSAATMTSQLSETIGTSGTVTQETTLGSQTTVEASVGIPEVFGAKISETFTVSTTEAQSTTVDQTKTTTSTAAVDVPPHDTKCAYIDLTTTKYSSEWSLPVCATGSFRCEYSDPCTTSNGAVTGYYHYGYFDQFSSSQCKDIKGTSDLTSSSAGSIVVRDGSC